MYVTIIIRVANIGGGGGLGGGGGGGGLSHCIRKEVGFFCKQK